MESSIQKETLPATIPSDSLLPAPEHGITFSEALSVWLKVALNSFGGPAGQIAVMHRILVEEKRWISENRFLHALNYCMLLPGPEAQQLATYIGWLMHGTIGGLTAGCLFVLPGFISILLLSLLYAVYQDTAFVTGLFFGLKAAVLAIVVEALIRIGKRALKNPVMYGIAASAFIAIFFFQAPFPLIILTAGLIGFFAGKIGLQSFQVIKGHSAKTDEAVLPVEEPRIPDSMVHHIKPTWGRTFRVGSVWLLIWWIPVFAFWLILGGDHVFVREGLFFSQAAVVTFGGAYSVLAYIAQQAVEVYGWLLPGEMLDGLGMAETTPGPLIQVVQFVGFMGAYRQPGSLSPITAGVIGSILTAWVTFAPCFLWIFLGAPYIESLRGNKILSSALSTITAAVVGVILNLTLWFFIHTIFHQTATYTGYGMHFDYPILSSMDGASVTVSILAFLLLFSWKTGMLTTLAICTGMGLVLWFILKRY